MDNGAIAMAYSGENLNKYIELVLAIIQSMRDGDLRQEQTGREAIYAGFIAIIGGLLTAGLTALCGALCGGALTAMATAYAVAEVDRFYNQGIDALEQNVAFLRAAHDQDETVWVFTTMWHGQSSATSGYYTGYGDEFPTQMLADIGSEMSARCAEWIGTHRAPSGVNSPGLMPGQDSSYQPQQFVAGCADVG